MRWAVVFWGMQNPNRHPLTQTENELDLEGLHLVLKDKGIAASRIISITVLPEEVVS